MRLVIEIDDQEIKDRLGELNEDRGQGGRERATLRELKARLQDPEDLSILAEYHLDCSIEMLG